MPLSPKGRRRPGLAPRPLRRRGIAAAVERLRRIEGVVSVGWGVQRTGGVALPAPGLVAHVRWKRESRRDLRKLVAPLHVDVVEIVPGRTLPGPEFEQSDFVQAGAPPTPRTSTMTALDANGADVIALVSGHGTLRAADGSFQASEGEAVYVEDPVLGRAMGQLLSGWVGPGYDFAYVRFTPTEQGSWNSWHMIAGALPVRLRKTPLVQGEGLWHFSELVGRRRAIAGLYDALVLHDVVLDDGAVGQVNLGYLYMVRSQQMYFALPGDSGSLVVDKDAQAVGVVVGSSGDHGYAYVLALDGAQVLDGAAFARLFREGT